MTEATADGLDFGTTRFSFIRFEWSLIDLAGRDGAGLKNALSGGNLGLTEASIWRISAYTDRCKDRR